MVIPVTLLIKLPMKLTTEEVKLQLANTTFFSSHGTNQHDDEAIDNSVVEIIAIEEISTGFSHLCFKVNTQAQVYFVKCFNESNIPTRDTEVSLTTLTAKVGLSPTVYYVDERFLITEFIDGVVLDKTALTQQDKIQQCLFLMDKLHTIKIEPGIADDLIPVLNIKDVINDLIHQLGSSSSFSSSLSSSLLSPEPSEPISVLSATLSSKPSSISSIQLEYIKEFSGLFLKALAVEPFNITATIPAEKLVICHGDINFSNIILSHQAYLLDFECACLAEKEFELGMMLAINNLSFESLISECELNETQQDKVTRYYLFSLFINGLWFLVASKTERESNVKIQLWNHAQRQFSRFDAMKFIPKNLTDIFEAGMK